MTRVTENSNTAALNFAISKAKRKLEDLQLKGSNLKKITKPSDDPVANIDFLSLKARESDFDQFLRNSNFAKTQLSFTENALTDLYEILVKAKEIAIGQASDIYNDDVRKNIAKEVQQLRDQALGIANRRLGNRYIFSGHATLTRPFEPDGKYLGDTGKVNLEIMKDFFVPINLNGKDVFHVNAVRSTRKDTPLDVFPQIKIPNEGENQEILIQDPAISMDGRKLASVVENTDFLEQTDSSQSLFSILGSLASSLEVADPDTIQSLLERFDDAITHMVTLRTSVGSIMNSIDNAEQSLESSKLLNSTNKSKVGDADVAELFSDLKKQESILQATYKSGNNLLNQSLLNFIR